MIIVCNRIPVKPEYATQLEERFADRAGLVNQMPGFISFQLLRPRNPEDPYVVMTFWETEEAFRAWTQSAEFKEGHSRSGQLPPEAFAGKSKAEIHEVIQTSEKVEGSAD